MQSWLNLHYFGGAGLSQASVADLPNNMPPFLSQVFHTIRSVGDNQAYFLRKAIRDLLCVPVVQVSSIYRSSGSRRSSSSASSLMGTNQGSMSAVYHSTTSSNFGHQFHHAHYGSSNLGSNAPALLTHYRYRHHPSISTSSQSFDHSNQSQFGSGMSSVSSDSLGSTELGTSNTLGQLSIGLVHSAPIIQKNPTHIAALQVGFEIVEFLVVYRLIIVIYLFKLPHVFLIYINFLLVVF